MLKCRLFYNTYFDTINIPNGYDDLIFSKFQHKDFPTMDLIQASLLSEIRIKVTNESDVIGADYLVLYDESYNPDSYSFTDDNIGKVVFYSIQGHNMTSYDVAVLSVTEDSVTSLGGPKNCFKFRAGNIERLSISKRLLSYINPLVLMNDELIKPHDPLIVEPLVGKDEQNDNPDKKPLENGDYYGEYVFFTRNQIHPYAPSNAFGFNRTSIFDCRAAGTYGNVPDYCFIKSCVDLAALDNNIQWEIYTDVDKEGVLGYPVIQLPDKDTYTETRIWDGTYHYTNPANVEVGWGSVGPYLPDEYFIDYSEIVNNKEPYQKVYHYQSTNALMRERIAKARSVGVESGISDSWIVPPFYVTSMENNADDSVKYMEGNYYVGKIRTNKGWGGEFIDPYDLYTIVAMGSGENKSVKMSDCVFGAYIALNSDPRAEGAPYFSLISPLNGFAPANFWDNSIKGANWAENPLAYTGKSGAFQEQVNFEYSQALKDAFASPEWQYINKGGVNATARNYANNIGSKGLLAGAVSAAITDPYTEYSMVVSGGNREELLALGNTIAINQQKREMEKQGEQNAFAMSQNIVAPTIAFGNYVNLTRDISGNALRVFHTHVSKKDRERFDYVTKYFGFKVNSPIYKFQASGYGLTDDMERLKGVYGETEINTANPSYNLMITDAHGAMDFNNNVSSVKIQDANGLTNYITHFNCRYVQISGAVLTGTNKTPKLMKKDAEAMLGNGVRIWYTAPQGAADPLQFETREEL